MIGKLFGSINKDLVPMKAHYFLWNAGTAPVIPFLSTYARQLGFSPVIVGLIYTILPVCGLVAKPLVGAISDRFKCQKIVFMAAQLLTAAAFLAINFAPEVPVDRQVQFKCEGEAVFDTSPSNMSVSDCTVDQLQSEEGTFSCDLDCLMKDEFWPIIVNGWNVTKFKDSHPETLSFEAAVNKSKTFKANDIVLFTIKDVSFDGKRYHPLCSGRSNYISTLCKIDCHDYNINELIADPSISDDKAYGLSQFHILLILMICGWVGQAISVSVGDAICFGLLGDETHKYGYQRLFGALGWGIFSIIAGFMVDALSVGSSKKNYEAAFYLGISFLLVDFIVSSRLKFTQRHVSSNIFRDVGRLLTNVRINIFLICCIAVGMATALMWQFAFFLMEDLAKAQGCDAQKWIKTLEGIAMSIQTLGGEMPFFFWSGKIIKRIGHINSMSLVMLVVGIRYILYSVITNPWWFLPIEFSNGLTFGLFYACMASYASIVAPPGTEATMQGMVGAIFEGVGVSLGSLVGGMLYGKYGGPLTFRIFGIGALIMCLLHAGVQYLLKQSDYEAQYSSPIEAKRELGDDEQELTPIK